MILAQPFDASTLAAIEKAIISSDLGLNPSNDGKIIRIPIPPLTEEHRKQLVKKVRSFGEEGKTAIRQVRRDANDEIKAMEKASDLSEDDSRRSQEQIQKHTDRHTGEIDAMNVKKEKELMEIDTSACSIDCHRLSAYIVANFSRHPNSREAR